MIKLCFVSTCRMILLQWPLYLLGSVITCSQMVISKWELFSKVNWCKSFSQGYVMIYFGNPKKHEVAAGAANITIFCQKVSKSCILPEYLGLGEDILECEGRNVMIYHGNPQTHKIARRGANMSASWQSQQNGMCTQRRLRSDWASAQSDQSFCCLHEGSLGP